MVTMSEQRIEGIEWMETESRGVATMKPKPKPKRKLKSSSTRKEFIGWGSKQVISFLKSIGKYSKDEQLSQHDVTDLISKYINDNNLVNPRKGKKKRVNCDEKLYALFGKKTISRIKVYDLLEPHFAENLEDEDFACTEDEYNDDDDDDDGDDDDDDDTVMLNWNGQECVVNTGRKKQKNLVSDENLFAALITDNIKLIYLRKCVVETLFKENNFELFVSKLVGSFVRTKSDPNDYLRTNSHILLQVTGVTKASGTSDANAEILLQVSNSVKTVRICMLSDDYFSEEELEDLRRRIKDGSLWRPTVLELQKKAQVLHRDITEHWIVREHSLLKNLIDRANEKGWRKELFEYLERRQLLQTPSEQARLLLEVPKVIAEVIEPEGTVAEVIQPEVTVAGHKHDAAITETDMVNLNIIATGEAKENFIDGSSRSTSRGCKDDDAVAESEIVNLSISATGEAKENSIGGSLQSTSQGHKDDAVAKTEIVNLSKTATGEEKENFIDGSFQSTSQGDKENATISETEIVSFTLSATGEPKENLIDGSFLSTSQVQEPNQPAEINKKGVEEVQHLHLGTTNFVQKAERQVIYLSDDDDDDKDNVINSIDMTDEDPGSRKWYYMDPQGDEQGPFPLLVLKVWSDAKYFPPGFMVWKTGQKQVDSVLLSDVLQVNFRG